MLRTFLSALFFLLAAHAQASECDPAFHLYWKPIEQALEARSPWNGYQPSEVPLAAVDASMTVYVRNFPESTIQKIDPSAKACSNISKLIRLDRVASRKVEAYEFYPSADAATADPLLQALAKGLGKPFVVLGTPSNAMFEPPSTWIPISWIWAVHEPFHLYQSAAFQESGGSPNPANCESQAGWKEFLVSEFEDWKKIGPALSEPGEELASDVFDSLKRLLKRRDAVAKDEGLLACLQQLREGERIEGTARFVDIHVRINSGSVNKQSRWDQELLPVLSIDPSRPFPYTQMPSFYATGALWCEVLASLRADNWQSMVETGDTQEIVVRKLFPYLHSR